MEAMLDLEILKLDIYINQLYKVLKEFSKLTEFIDGFRRKFENYKKKNDLFNDRLWKRQKAD